MKGDYRVTSGLACYLLVLDEKGIIVDSAPIAKAWRKSHINVFRRAFPKAKIEKLKGENK